MAIYLKRKLLGFIRRQQVLLPSDAKIIRIYQEINGSIFIAYLSDDENNSVNEFNIMIVTSDSDDIYCGEDDLEHINYYKDSSGHEFATFLIK